MVSKSAKSPIVAPVVGLTGSAYGGSLKSGVMPSVLCRCVWQDSGFSRRENGFTLIYFKIKSYKICEFNAICKYNGAITCVTVQQKGGLFLPTLTCHTLDYNSIQSNSIIYYNISNTNSNDNNNNSANLCLHFRGIRSFRMLKLWHEYKRNIYGLTCRSSLTYESRKAVCHFRGLSESYWADGVNYSPKIITAFPGLIIFHQYSPC